MAGVERGWLGVSVQDLAAEEGRGSRRGVLIAGVERNSPAGKAGLRQGDLVLAINGDRIETSRALVRTVAAVPPGQTLRLTVLRECLRARTAGAGRPPAECGLSHRGAGGWYKLMRPAAGGNPVRGRNDGTGRGAIPGDFSSGPDEDRTRCGFRPVEDDAEVARFARKGLQEAGHTVEHATNGRDGLFLAASEQFDVMVVDRMMPGGWTACAWSRPCARGRPDAGAVPLGAGRGGRPGGGPEGRRRRLPGEALRLRRADRPGRGAGAAAARPVGARPCCGSASWRWT